jgi:hypothetical protein
MPRQVGVGDRLARMLAGTTIRDRRRWIGPVIAALGGGVLIWLAMPHVPWYVKLPLALLALGYIGAQSAAYLGHGDEAQPGDSTANALPDGESRGEAPPSPLQGGSGRGSH